MVEHTFRVIAVEAKLRRVDASTFVPQSIAAFGVEDTAPVEPRSICRILLIILLGLGEVESDAASAPPDARNLGPQEAGGGIYLVGLGDDDRNASFDIEPAIGLIAVRRRIRIHIVLAAFRNCDQRILSANG